MFRKLAVLLAASAFALAACDSPADDPVDDATESVPAEAIATPAVAPEPAEPLAPASGAAADDTDALQAAYDEGKAAAEQALDEGTE